MVNIASETINDHIRQIQEIGPTFTSSLKTCQGHLNKIFKDGLDPEIVARLISMMITYKSTDGSIIALPNWDMQQQQQQTSSTRTNLENSAPLLWDGSVFVKTIRTMLPTLNWHDVISNLDNPFFFVLNKSALQLLMQILVEGVDKHTFPIGFLYRVWNGNKAGQLSWLQQIVTNPDIFYILDYPNRTVNCTCLKVMPDENSRQIAQWKCLDIVEVLFRLSEINNLTTTVYNFFRSPNSPASSCPDIFFLGVVQIALPLNQLRFIFLKQLAATLLAGHANVNAVLSYAWNYEKSTPELKQTIINAISSYYLQMPEDQTRLTRILQTAHELKPNGLTELLNYDKQYGFVIDLACLASRRDFLKLDKFLDDKLNEHGDAFAHQILSYVKRRYPGITGANLIPTDTMTILYAAMQSRANISPTFAQEFNLFNQHLRNLQQAKGDIRMTNSGVRTPLNMSNPLSSSIGGSTSGIYPQSVGQQQQQQQQQQFSSTTTGTQKASNPSGAGSPGVRTPINLPNQPAGSAHGSQGTPDIIRIAAAAALGLNNSGPFPLFQQRDSQLMRNMRGNSGLPFLPLTTTTTTNFPAGGNATGNNGDFTDNLENATFSDEVQEEANSYFQQIYSPTGQMHVTDFIQKLKQFRDSSRQRDKELLLCVVKNLFDEYKFFQDYPERELKTTAEVYGGIIRENIVQNLQFATALRKVVDSLQAEPQSALWQFGIVALNSCRYNLHKYPKVCGMIVGIDSFNRFPVGLREYITNGVQNALPNVQPPPSAQQQQQQQGRDSASWVNSGIPIGLSSPMTPVNVPLINVSTMKFTTPTRGQNASSGTSILNVTNVDTLINAMEKEGTQAAQPAQIVLERVSFLCNNLSQSNLVRKTEEISELIKESGEEILPWFAQYLVTKRVSVEQNFQPLYNNFLIAVGNEKLDKHIEKETYRNVDILLRSVKSQTAGAFGDRQLLKNLGHWLGTITIARDRPILAKDLDLKFLLLEAFYKGQHELLCVVPFVAKTVVASNKSTIFMPRCAWIYGIVKVLVEIHNEPDLKLNLKFEIEVLCKELNIDIRSVEIGSYLKEASRLPKLVPIKQENPSPVPQFRIGTGSVSSTTSSNQQQHQLAKDDENQSQSTSQLQQQQQQRNIIGTPTPIVQPIAQMQPTFHYNDINIYLPEGLSQHLKDHSNLPFFQMYPQFKVLCKTAIVCAIRELIGGITDRSINVASTVTEHIIKKDFAFDSDDKHLIRAAHQMMRSMTAGMAAITCREPLTNSILSFLKTTICNNLSNFIGSTTLTTEQLKQIDETAFQVMEANLEVATNFIVKSACEKASAEVEKRLDLELISRRLAQRENRQILPPTGELLSMIERVPEKIRIKPGSLTDENLKIYDDFSLKICGFKALTQQEVMVEFARRNQPAGSTPGGGGGGHNNFDFQMLQQHQQQQQLQQRPSSSNLRSHLPGMPERGGGGGVVQQIALPPGIFGGTSTENINGGGEHSSHDDQTQFQMKVEEIFRQWINIWNNPAAQRDPAAAASTIAKLMQQNGVLTDDIITKFFKQCADLCFNVSYRLLSNDLSTEKKHRCYYTLDAFVKLTCLMVKYSDGSQHLSKIKLLKNVLNIVTNALLIDHENRKEDFNGLPYHRIIITMFIELTTPDPILDSIMWNILEAFGQALFLLQPRRAPGFAYHWLDIVGHRNFIGRLLAESLDPARSGAMYTQLIICHLKFLAPFLRNVQMPKQIAYIYRGTLRVLLVILHDFPEILCEYHYVLCDVIPANCVQLRNLVLSPFPRDMRLPDPFTQSMDVIESLPEMSQHPKMHRETTNIFSTNLRHRLDDYLANRTPVEFLSELPVNLQITQTPGSKYNASMINNIVLYVGVRAIDSIQQKNQRISMAKIAHTPFMDIFQNLTVSLCTEGRYLLFNAIANQLRYPNSHTHYFSCTLLYLFLEANAEVIQEQITRILFERLLAVRPHPWGLLITFIELIRNPRYDFWSHQFVRCAPEIEKLFRKVAITGLM